LGLDQAYSWWHWQSTIESLIKVQIGGMGTIQIIVSNLVNQINSTKLNSKLFGIGYIIRYPTFHLVLDVRTYFSTSLLEIRFLLKTSICHLFVSLSYPFYPFYLSVASFNPSHFWSIFHLFHFLLSACLALQSVASAFQIAFSLKKTLNWCFCRWFSMVLMCYVKNKKHSEKTSFWCILNWKTLLKSLHHNTKHT